MLQLRPNQIILHPNAVNAAGRGMQWKVALIELPVYNVVENKQFDFSVTTEDRHKRPWRKKYLHG